MYYTKKYRKYNIKSKYNKNSKKHLVKNKKIRKTRRIKKKSKKYNKSKKQSGGYGSMSLTNNPLTWTFLDAGNNLINTLNGTPIPANSNPTSDQFK